MDLYTSVSISVLVQRGYKQNTMSVIITIIIITFSGSQTTANDTTTTTLTAIEYSDATTVLVSGPSDNEASPQNNIGPDLLVGVAVTSASFVVLVAIFMVVVCVGLLVNKKGQGSKTGVGICDEGEVKSNNEFVV